MLNKTSIKRLQMAAETHAFRGAFVENPALGDFLYLSLLNTR